eukprot:TRINITY_DN949_c3_g1_i2.p1 TRINITY_DN949_c3_g1~~TRINITY_DN949_c3_g1_i2.p1  ORF type:complete len:123 (+),score=23.61 TRINITY_DN949_c3_g1_i2:73-441(+)
MKVSFSLSLLVLLCSVLFVSSVSVVKELSYESQDCSSGGSVSNEWKVDVCVGVGNQPPFRVSETVKIDLQQAVFSYFAGGNCTDTPYQSSNQTLNKCSYFAGTIYTMFVHVNTSGGTQELRQ